ncbi:MAG: 23S rRNA (pseudouridine(1915)-N(3))-methyltransferase RlmH [Eubacteriales bacterium]
MQSIHFITVGKLKETFYKEARAEYVKRLGAYCKLTETVISEEKLPMNPTEGEIARCLEKEGEKILEKIPSSAKVVVLCVEGKLLDSPEISSLLTGEKQGEARHLVFIIGGSYGIGEKVKQRGNIGLSMSKMTFPHHLAQIMLLEQIYRGFKIEEGSSYHK